MEFVFFCGNKCVKFFVLRKPAEGFCVALEHFEPRQQIAKAGRWHDYYCRNHTKTKSKLIYAKPPRKHL